MKKSKSYLMPAEVAEMLAVSVVTVRSLTESGQLKSFTTAGGHRRFRQNDVAQYANENGLVLNLPAKKNYKVLIVDDDLPFSRALDGVVNDLPCNVETDVAQNGFQAGYKARQMMPDLILLDIMMPGVSGVEVTMALKEQPETNHIRIIGMTGGATESASMKMISKGAEKVLRKPFDIEELVDAIGEDELAQFRF